MLATKGQQKIEKEGCQASGAVKSLRRTSCKLTEGALLSAITA